METLVTKVSDGDVCSLSGVHVPVDYKAKRCKAKRCKAKRCNAKRCKETEV